jgi:Ca2+-transporting ATPase
LAKPRPQSEKLVKGQVLRLAGVQGLILLLGAVISFLIAVNSEYSDERVRSVTFGTILLGNLLLMLSNRSSTASVLELLSGRKNKLALRIFAAGIAAMFLIYLLSPVRDAFGLAALGVTDILLISLCSFPAVVWFELHKLRVRTKALFVRA